MKKKIYLKLIQNGRRCFKLDFDLEFWLQILSLVFMLGAFYSKIKVEFKYICEKIDKLEKKQDKHNNLIERMVIVEQSTTKAHQRIDDMRSDNQIWRGNHKDE